MCVCVWAQCLFWAAHASVSGDKLQLKHRVGGLALRADTLRTVRPDQARTRIINKIYRNIYYINSNFSNFFLLYKNSLKNCVLKVLDKKILILSKCTAIFKAETDTVQYKWRPACLGHPPGPVQNICQFRRGTVHCKMLYFVLEFLWQTVQAMKKPQGNRKFPNRYNQCNSLDLLCPNMFRFMKYQF